MAPPPFGIQGEWTVLGAFYDFRVVVSVHLMPDIQYVIDPDASVRFPETTVIGI